MKYEVYGDHLEVIVRGAPGLNVTLEEVGLRGPRVRNDRVGGATHTPRTRHWRLDG